jgi:hypothetical protein
MDNAIMFSCEGGHHMPTWFWISVAGFVASFLIKTAIKHDCFGMMEIPPQWNQTTQKWFKRGMGATISVMLMPLGPVIKDFVAASAHGIATVHNLDKRNADDYRRALDDLNA